MFLIINVIKAISSHFGDQTTQKSLIWAEFRAEMHEKSEIDDIVLNNAF